MRKSTFEHYKLQVFNTPAFAYGNYSLVPTIETRGHTLMVRLDYQTTLLENYPASIVRWTEKLPAMVTKLLHFVIPQLRPRFTAAMTGLRTTNLDPILHESVRYILSQLSHARMLWASTGQPLVLVVYLWDISPTTLDGRGWPSVTCCMGTLQ